jgi:hypothetical protein
MSSMSLLFLRPSSFSPPWADGTCLARSTIAVVAEEAEEGGEAEEAEEAEGWVGICIARVRDGRAGRGDGVCAHQLLPLGCSRSARDGLPPAVDAAAAAPPPPPEAAATAPPEGRAALLTGVEPMMVIPVAPPPSPPARGVGTARFNGGQGGS